jgi:molecular chaperone DnaK
MNKDIVVGIDLGTTNSEIAIVRDGEVVVLQENGSAILPSVVGIDPQGQLLVGAPARNQYALRPDATIRSIKRKMGTDESIPLGDATYSPPEISAMILRTLKARAEAALGHPVHRAVVTVPAYFTDAQRHATREAGELAGFVVERLLNEPTAAAFAYELGRDSRTASTILVYDLGGGTFDVSILRMQGEVVEVLATHGNTRLGGDDVDQLLLQQALDAFAQRHPGASLTPGGRIRLELDCEQLKVDLSNQSEATLANLALPIEGGSTVSFEWTVSRHDFETWTRNLFDGTLDSVHAALQAARLSAKDIDEILLVGGSTRSPYVADMLHAELGKRPRGDVHPDLAVAYGAGVMAARLMGESKHRILVDITPYTFGVESMSHDENGLPVFDVFSPIIPAGTPLPCSRGDIFTTCSDGQAVVAVNVLQGESPFSSQNLPVGEFKVQGLDPDAPAGSHIHVDMKLDLDGILTVTAKERHTGLQKSVVMKDAFAQPSPEALEARRAKLDRLFGSDPADETDDDPAASPDAPSHVPSQVLFELRRRIDRCRDRIDQEDIDELEAIFQDLVNAKDQAQADDAMEEIENILFYAESQ